MLNATAMAETLLFFLSWFPESQAILPVRQADSLSRLARAAT